MAVVLFVISLFGNLSVIRLLSHFRTRALIPSQLLTKIGTGTLVLINGAVFFCAHDFIFAIFSVIGGVFAMSISLFIFERRQIDALKKEVPGFLDRWILNMKLGQSLSAARTAAISDISPHANTLLTPLFVGTQNTPREHLILGEKLRQELIEIGHASHSALQRLENARTWMRKSEDFRRKSGQAVRQTRIQSIVLLVLLIALAAFTVHRYGWRRNSDLVMISFLLSGLGIFTMQHLARKTRWKI